MKTSAQLFSLFLSLSLLGACTGQHQSNCNDDNIAFQEAAARGDIRGIMEMMKLGSKRKVNPYAHCDKHNTALINAVKNGQLEGVRWMLKMKLGDHRIPDKDNGFLPLHWAASNGQVAIIEVLLKYDAQVNSKTTNGVSPLHCAASNGHAAVAKVLMEHGAASHDHTAAVTKILQGCDPGVANKRNLTNSLHCAALQGHVAVVRVLIEHGMDINDQDEEGDTALIIAAYYGHLSVVEELMRRGANKDRQNKSKKTALTVAVEKCQQEIALALIGAKANLDIKDSKGWSALKYARSGESKNQVIEKALLANGAKEYLLRKKIMKYLPGAAKITAETGVALAPLL